MIAVVRGVGLIVARGEIRRDGTDGEGVGMGDAGNEDGQQKNPVHPRNMQLRSQAASHFSPA